MTASENYTPPSVWTWDKQNGGKFASTNRPVAGPTHEKNLPVASPAPAVLTGYAQWGKGDDHAGGTPGPGT